jgi:hypothetical protein
MTTLFNSLLTLLLLLGGTGQALADQLPPPSTEVTAQVAQNVDTGTPPSPRLLAWQRVGSPLREA